jgi:plastocyanin
MGHHPALKRLLLVVALAVLPAGSPAAVAPASLKIEIKDMAFAKAKMQVRIGDTIEWVNNDIVDHTATAKTEAWSVTMAPGKSARVVMKEAGTIDYFCRYHPNMTGTLVVGARSGK